MNTLTLSEARERGLRIKEARIFAGFKSARAFCERHSSIALSTIKAWESGKHYVLTPKGAYLISMALKQHHVDVSVEWLLDGKGLGPTSKSAATTNIETADSLAATLLERHDDSIHAELNDFIQTHEHAVHYQMPNDSMKPAFSKNDWLCGYWINPNEYSALHRCYALVEQPDGAVICCYILNHHQNTIHGQTLRSGDPFYITTPRIAMITRVYRSANAIIKPLAATAV